MEKGKKPRIMNLNTLGAQLPPSVRMPVLFIGHGSPMNAITDTTYSRSWSEMGKKLPAPKVILCISAHWLTIGTSVAVTARPKTIHDFRGFPDELFQVQYPATGAPEMARLSAAMLQTKVTEDDHWGLDHGAWSILRYMYPAADVPVFQMSVALNKPAAYHFEVGRQLSALREKGVLIVASGNVVHNLDQISWNNPGQNYDWAIEFDELVKNSIEENNPEPLIAFEKLGALARQAHPSPDHYYPLMYSLGLRRKEDQFTFFNDSFDMGSISMRSVLFS
jgi:4,5-DOPA dioxygenase extradiol